MPAYPSHARATSAAFLLTHGLLIPAAFAVAAIGARACGIDDDVTRFFFDPVARVFAARDSAMLEAFGHRTAKSAVLLLWLVLLAAAVTATCLQRFARSRAALWTTVAAMASGPSVVRGLKELNSYHCPWDLKRFGGLADAAAGWFVPAGEVGRCFPGGHAAGGFSLVALAFAGLAFGRRRLWLGGLAATLLAGPAFSAVRIAQGAHFLSHNLWSAAIDWCVAALVFAPMMGHAGDSAALATPAAAAPEA